LCDAVACVLISSECPLSRRDSWRGKLYSNPASFAFSLMHSTAARPISTASLSSSEMIHFEISSPQADGVWGTELPRGLPVTRMRLEERGAARSGRC
jgi:hypothetical protein